MQKNKLYVGNLDYSTSNDELQNLFSSYGEIKSIKIIEGKGFAFVELGDDASAEKAQAALNQTDFKGRTIKVDLARPPQNNRDGDRPSFRRNDGDRPSFRRNDGGGSSSFGRRNDGQRSSRPRRDYND